jgi:hypothetical protein
MPKPISSAAIHMFCESIEASTAPVKSHNKLEKSVLVLFKEHHFENLLISKHTVRISGAFLTIGWLK